MRYIRIIKNACYMILFVTFLGGCGNPSPQQLSGQLIDAIESQNVGKVQELLDKGANPYALAKDGRIPFKICVLNNIRADLFGQDIEENRGILVSIGYHARRIDRQEIAEEGTLSVQLEMVGGFTSGQMVAHTIFKTLDAEYELKIGRYETKLIGFENKGGQLDVKPGGKYRVVGTLVKTSTKETAKTIEVDSVEYLGGGAGNFVCPISNYFPSTFEYSGF